MKKWMIARACLFGLSACQQKTEKQDMSRVNAVRDSLSQVINQKDSELNDIMGTFNDIQEGFRQINAAQGRVNLEQANPEKMSKGDIMNDISFIQRTLQLNKERIARLREQLKTSSFYADKLKVTIDELQKEMKEKQAQIDLLTAQLKEKDIKIEEQGQQINNLNKNVSDLTASNDVKAQTVAHQEKELNTAWYVFGTKRELKNQGIVKSGNILKSSNYNKDYFTKIDIRVVKSIKLYSKSATLLTSHPASSYSLERDAQKQYTLYIANPSSFWSVSRYLVILVK